MDLAENSNTEELTIESFGTAPMIFPAALPRTDGRWCAGEPLLLSLLLSGLLAPARPVAGSAGS